MSHLAHRHAELTAAERWSVTVAAVLVILAAWGTAVVMYVAAAGLLVMLWFADSVRHHRIVFLTGFAVAAVITFKSLY